MNPFEHTGDVSIELSNLCQFAWLHERCPLHLEMASPWLVKEPKILSARIVYRVLDTLAEFDYRQQVTFSLYNEPLIDPRLLSFVQYARKCGVRGIHINTNGHYLTLGLAQELEEAGMTVILVSLYGSQAEREMKAERLKEWQQHLSLRLCSVGTGLLDTRLSAYGRPVVGKRQPCSSPLGQVVVTRDAEVILCCIDWRRQYVFGNLEEQSLEEILLSDEVRDTYRRLSSGDRFLDICQRCDTGRG